MTSQQSDIDFFVNQLHHSKQHFDGVVEAYWDDTLRDVHGSYGDASLRAMKAFADIVARGGKRIRAALAEQAYRMFDGQDQQIIDRMGLALEMIHGYLLIADDVSDQSDLRRGGP